MRCKMSRGRVRVAPQRGPVTISQLFSLETIDSGKSTEVLTKFVESTASKGVQGLRKEYSRLGGQADQDATFEAFKANMPKNRYSDVLCADITRVQLKLGGSEYGDYIHANHIPHPFLQNKFICTQGPLQNTIHDFWRMIFEEQIQSIVMLCRPSEDGRPKCNIYWPENAGDTKDFPMFTVSNHGEESDEFNTITLVISLKDGLEPSLVPRLRYVKLIRWTSWPDRGIPEDNNSAIVIRLLERISTGATAIHCSAGIGRTGSLMAIEIALKYIEKGKNFDFEQAQYLYIHRVLVEHACVRADIKDEVKQIGKKFIAKYDEGLKNKLVVK